jgi:hypothetical protein
MLSATGAMRESMLTECGEFCSNLNRMIMFSRQVRSIRCVVEKAFAQIDVPIAWEGVGVEEKGFDAKSGRVLSRRISRQDRLRHLKTRRYAAKTRRCFAAVSHGLERQDFAAGRAGESVCRFPHRCGPGAVTGTDQHAAGSAGTAVRVRDSRRLSLKCAFSGTRPHIA